jgi:hypothetical protein
LPVRSCSPAFKNGQKHRKVREALHQPLFSSLPSVGMPIIDLITEDAGAAHYSFK